MGLHLYQVFDTGKTLIIFACLLASLCLGNKLPTRKIHFYFPSCTINYIFIIFLTLENIVIIIYRIKIIRSKIRERDYT